MSEDVTMDISQVADVVDAYWGHRAASKFSGARTTVEAIAYSYGYRTGIAWRDLPAVFGRWQTAWKWHRRMGGDGTWLTA